MGSSPHPWDLIEAFWLATKAIRVSPLFHPFRFGNPGKIAGSGWSYTNVKITTGLDGLFSERSSEGQIGRALSADPDLPSAHADDGLIEGDVPVDPWNSASP